MRHEKAVELVKLAQRLASSAEGLTLDEMAAAVGVGRRTAERMRDALEALFPGLEAVAEGASKRFRIAGGLYGFMQSPTPEELLELTKAAAALHGAGASPRARTLETLERKVRAAMRGQTLRRMAPDLDALARAETIVVQAGPRPYEDETLIGAIRHALMAMRALRFAYHGGSTPGAIRTVSPYGLVFGRANYLVAAEIESQEPRNWRLDRMAQVEVLEMAASAPEDFRLRDYADRSFGVFQDRVETVVLRVLPAGADDARGWRFHPTQTLEDQADGSVIVRFHATGMRELAWHIFTWGDQLQILEPGALKEEMRQALSLANACHRAD
jgi:predicted DNA-binding transcriptional regulator YafY